jgi:hypothetical protein
MSYIVRKIMNLELQKIISYAISYMLENVDLSQGSVEIGCGWHWLMLTCNLFYLFLFNLFGTNISNLIEKISSRIFPNLFLTNPSNR